MKRLKRLPTAIIIVGLCTIFTCYGAPTEIKISDKVIVPNTVRLGINMTGDNYFSGAVLTKMRIVENFEGALLRQCHFGPISSADGVSTYFRDGGAWDQFALDGEIVLLSGPQQWERRKVVKVTKRPYEQGGKTKQARFFVLDKPIIPLKSNDGFMIIADKLELGHMRGYHPFWNTEKNKLELGDVRPGGFGTAALRLAGSEMPSHYRFVSHDKRHAEVNGKWKVRFWAKSVGKPKATLSIVLEAISLSKLNTKTSISVSEKWTQFEKELIMANAPEPKSADEQMRVGVIFKAPDADILIDDVEIWMEGHTNPTAFTDDCVRALKKFNPGSLRIIQMGGSTIDNMLSPRLRMRSYGSQQNTKNSPSGPIKTYSYSLPEYYALCEEINSEPWYCLPGTILPEELEQFLEYVAGDVNTAYGKRRVADGHPKPWSDTFSRIHVEFGNEAWNNASDYQCGGYNGADYWRALIEKAKASPNYRKNIIFHTAGQASYSYRNKGIMKKAPNSDAFSVGPYIMHNFKKEDMSAWKTDEDFFRWAFAWPIDRSLSEGRSMTDNYKYAKQNDIELSIYEVNHHITGGDGPLEPRNKLVTSISGGINLCNNNLLMLREHGIRTQNLYSLIQHRFRTPVGHVRLWGTTLNMRKGHERYRPTSLAGRLANRVMEGNLITTAHSKHEPTFTATGRFENNVPNTSLTYPTLWSYAFKNGKKRGLIIFNLDVSKSHKSIIKFDGQVQPGATMHLLTGDTLDANNEFEVAEPQVTISEKQLPDFKSGSQITVPPHSMVVVEWKL